MATREFPRSPAVEDYCKAIFALESRTEQPVATNPLAERLGLTPGSVSAMLKRLGELGLIAHHPYRGVRLTGEGRAVALEVIRHHRLLELFLAETLGMPWDRVHAEAEVLEHVISEDLEALIAAALGHPTRRPARRPDPERRARAADDETAPLRARAGRAGPVRARPRRRSRDAPLPAELGIAPGDRLNVRERQPFDGPLSVAFGDGEGRAGAHALAPRHAGQLDRGRSS